MSTVLIEAVGMKCPQPVFKVAAKSLEMKPGDILEITGDCLTFEKDIRTWCERNKKVCLAVKDEGENKKRIQIQF
jgi:tRNA 2-thiouridine synthesizing protein A